jgi:hypothetical protein
MGFHLPSPRGRAQSETRFVGAWQWVNLPCHREPGAADVAIQLEVWWIALSLLLLAKTN